MKKLFAILSITLLTISTISCQKDDELGGTSVQKAVGEWETIAYSIGNADQTLTECFKKGTFTFNSDGTFSRTAYTNEVDCIIDTERTGSGTYEYIEEYDQFKLFYEGNPTPKIADIDVLRDANKLNIIERPSVNNGTILFGYYYQRK